MDSTKLGLGGLAGTPEFYVTIGDADFGFSQLPVIPQKAALDDFLRRNIPHPMEAVKPHLAGLEPDDRRFLLNEARKEAKDWPPCLETKSGRVALVNLASGLQELFFQALTVHHPAMTRDYAEKLYVQLEKEQAAKGQSEVKRLIHKLFAVWFNLTTAEDEEGLPKASSSQEKNGSTGSFSFVGASGS